MIDSVKKNDIVKAKNKNKTYEKRYKKNEYNGEKSKSKTN